MDRLSDAMTSFLSSVGHQEEGENGAEVCQYVVE